MRLILGVFGVGFIFWGGLEISEDLWIKEGINSYFTGGLGPNWPTASLALGILFLVVSFLLKPRKIT